MVKAPTFASLRASSPTSSAAKRKNRKTGGEAEVALRALLWQRGFRFRKSVRKLPGCPDIVFAKQRLAVFVDGDFWHGRRWSTRKEILAKGHNPHYWIDKIAYNILRDKFINETLGTLGWTVLRLWETDVLHNPELAVTTITKYLRQLGLNPRGHKTCLLT